MLFVHFDGTGGATLFQETTIDEAKKFAQGRGRGRLFPMGEEIDMPTIPAVPRIPLEVEGRFVRPAPGLIGLTTDVMAIKSPNMGLTIVLSPRQVVSLIDGEFVHPRVMDPWPDRPFCQDEPGLYPLPGDSVGK